MRVTANPVCSPRITRKSRYAVRALAELALRRDLGPVCAARVARRRAIPERFLEQIFAELHRAGLLRSRRGAGGGYALAVPPEEITVLDVVEVLDGASCPGGTRGAPGDETDRVFEEAGRALGRVLEGYNIADLATEGEADPTDRATPAPAVEG